MNHLEKLSDKGQLTPGMQECEEKNNFSEAVKRGANIGNRPPHEDDPIVVDDSDYVIK